MKIINNGQKLCLGNLDCNFLIFSMDLLEVKWTELLYLIFLLSKDFFLFFFPFSFSPSSPFFRFRFRLAFGFGSPSSLISIASSPPVARVENS